MTGKHPPEASLALLASGDVGRLERWRIERHVAACGECRALVGQHAALRSTLAQAVDPPDLAWNQMAAEMRANIRLGLEAGECVGQPTPASSFFGLRSLAACASLAVLLIAALWLERPAPPASAGRSSSGSDQIILEATGNGIQVSRGGQSLGLMHGRARNVDYFASGMAMRARYVDPDTGNVTINNVYGQ